MAKAKLEKGAVFERYEKKFLMNQTQYQMLMILMKNKMEIDEYGKHTICTLYYDTDDYAIIRNCLDKPTFREKLRLRSYGVPKSGDTVYLELKKKMAGITYKRRIATSLTNANAYMNKKALLDQQNQISGEIDWYVNQQDLSGKVVVCYDRLALFGKENETLRITIDSGIRWRDYNLSLDKGDFGSLILPGQTYLMEIKTMDALPFWLAHILAQLEVFPASFSKYGTIYRDCLSQKEAMRYAI